MIFLNCCYEEPDPSTYAGIELRMGIGRKKEVFNTGDPFHDYLTAGAVAHMRAGEDADVMGLSSMDHFSMDGGVLLDGMSATDDQIKAALEAARAYLGDPR